MIIRTGIAKTPREHFMRGVDDELAKFERKERAFRQAEREERAARLKLPIERKPALFTGRFAATTER
jgi:hypothetical protein